MATVKVDETLDVRGLICPYPLIEAREKLKTMRKGQVLEVISDYKPAAETTIPYFCQKKGYPVEIIQEAESLWRLYIERTDD
ncbi:MAG: sulfurtransferase TusA family protein [Chloroflexi bacterium]|nr:sulfurtransferase TusA family protein [Chloroflexota bacterium]